MTNALRLRLDVAELRADRQFAVAYLKAAQEELDDPDNRAAGLLALRDVVKACQSSRKITFTHKSIWFGSA